MNQLDRRRPLPQGAPVVPESVGTLRLEYRRTQRRRMSGLAALLAVLLWAVLTDLGLGATDIGAGDILRAVGLPDTVDAQTRIVVQELRLPFTLMAVLVGASLSLAGAEMQTVLDNPLASPFTLGVSSAASLGAALGFVLGLGLPGVPVEWLVSVNAFVFAFGSVLLLQAATRAVAGNRHVLVLCGVAMVFTFNALVALLQYVASPDALQQLVFWSMGSLSRASWPKLQIMAAVLLLTLPFAMRAAWSLNVLRLGVPRARSLGLDVRGIQFWSLLRISVLAATAVAFAGTIGFVGLVGPHIARMLLGEDHRFLVPGSALVGALLLSLASMASKTLVSGAVLPIGIVTAVVGVPVLLWLIFRKGGRT